MKTLVALVAALVTVSGYLINVPVPSIQEPTLAPSGWIHMQKLMLPLFENVCEISENPRVLRLSQEFMTTATTADFWNGDSFTKLQQLKSANSFLAKGEIFTEYNPDHLTELIIIFDVLKNAKTFDLFYKAASWARQNLNCGLYVDAIYMALETRRDTDKLTLPPPYELLPNYFIRKDIIIQGSSLLAGQDIAKPTGVRDEGNAYTLDANYTANIYEGDDEAKLAYYREDVGLNSYYFLSMLKDAPWRTVDVDINSRYGEMMYLWMKQWTARYNLERYANGLAEIDGLGWDIIADIPYDPMLVYSNGNEFIHRTAPMVVEENEDKAMLKTIETNLAIVVGHMRDGGYNKTQILNHLMEILVTGEKSYDSLARRLLGKALSNNGNPSVLEHYMTSLRDPLFWKLNKKIVDLIDNALKVLPQYTKNELYFPGVEVVNVEVKKMMTSFDYFEFDITDALKIGNGDTTFQVKIGQPRLTNKPFTIKISVSSLVTQKGLVKIYLGPKVAPGEFSKNKNLFALLDCFDINLKKGSNIVTRSSADMSFSSDFVSLRTLSKKVEDAQFGLDSLPLNSMNSQIQYPSRLVLPKGTPEGLPLQLLVFVAPYMKTSLTGMYTAASMEFNEAIMSKLYPLDLPIEDNMLLGLPNLMFKDTMVTHKATGNGGSGGAGGYAQPAQPNTWAGQYGKEAIVPVGDNMHQVLQEPKLKLEYDYSSKKNGGFNSKPSYQKSDYASYKKFDYKNINKDVPTEAPIDVPIEAPEVIEIINMPEIEPVGHDVLQTEYKPLEMQNDSPEPVQEMYTPLQSGYSSKKTIDKSTGPYKKSDYSYKKFDQKNIDIISVKPNKVPTLAPIVPTQPSVGTSTVKHIEIFRIPDIEGSEKNYKVDEINTSTEEADDVDSMKTFKVLEVDEKNKAIRVIPMLKLSTPKQEAFTIYDYVIHWLNEDDMKKLQEKKAKEEDREERAKEQMKTARTETYIHTD